MGKYAIKSINLHTRNAMTLEAQFRTNCGYLPSLENDYLLPGKFVLRDLASDMIIGVTIIGGAAAAGGCVVVGSFCWQYGNI